MLAPETRWLLYVIILRITEFMELLNPSQGLRDTSWGKLDQIQIYLPICFIKFT